jgi:Zn-dependent peptidase ImmA (M78 family)
MERFRIGGRVYTDPDVLSLIRTSVQPIDPQREVVRRARALNQKLRNWGDEIANPRERLEVLASLAGLKVAPMSGSGLGSGAREALVYKDRDGSRRIYYDPTLPEGRANFSIAHEIVHTFFPPSGSGARFRSLCADDSREANELVLLCHRGAAELLMPVEEFAAEIGDEASLSSVPRLCHRFGSSYEATVYRLATAHSGVALAGLLQFRYRKEELRRIASQHQPFLFVGCDDGAVPKPKLRRQSLHASDQSGSQHIIPWNKSFEEDSCVYRAGAEAGIQLGVERLPNRCGDFGTIEATKAPFQRAGVDPAMPDVLFFWSI